MLAPFIGSSERVKAHSRIKPVLWILLPREGKYSRPCNVIFLLLSLTAACPGGFSWDARTLRICGKAKDVSSQGSVKRKLNGQNGKVSNDYFFGWDWGPRDQLGLKYNKLKWNALPKLSRFPSLRPVSQITTKIYNRSVLCSCWNPSSFERTINGINDRTEYNVQEDMSIFTVSWIAPR